MNTLIPVLKIGLLGLLSTAVVTQAAVPSSGAYVTDPQFQHVADKATDSVSNVNMILCFIANTRADAMVNLGTYVAYIDESKCNASAKTNASNSSNTTSTGTSAYSRVSLTSTRATNTDPQLVKGHAEVSGGGGGGGKQHIYFHVNATAAPSATAPNGELTMNYAGMNLGSHVMRGYINVTANTVNYGETSTQGGNRVVLMNLTGNSSSGSGAISAPNNNGGGTTTFTFGYDGTHFCRSDGTTEKCFDRAAANANTPVWRYGVYTAAGARYDLANPGFNIKDASGDYGYASYWGVWLPNTPADGATITNATNNTAYTIKKTTGNLVKYSQVKTTLNHIAKVPFVFWTQQGVASLLPSISLSPNTNYEAYWDDTTSSFVITGQQSCTPSGCFTNQVLPTISLTAVQMDNAISPSPLGGTGNGFQAGSQALGGNIIIPNTTLADPSPGTLLNGVAYFTQTNVLPGDATVPPTLVCVRDCPTVATLTGVPTPPAPYVPFVTATNNWGSTPFGSEVTYTWDSATYTLTAPDGLLSNTNIPSILIGTPYEWGIQTGTLVKPSELSVLACPIGSTYCDFQAYKLTEYYVYTTGTQQWNTSTYLKNTDSSYVIFTPPQSAAFTVPANTSSNVPYGTFAGSVMNLQFIGFGQLQGIPGKCYSFDDNTEANCGSNSKFVPAFSIPWDANGKITIAGVDYFVKWLEREVDFKVMVGDTHTTLGITMGNLSNLPAAPVLSGDINDPSYPANTSIYPGDFATVNFKKAPAVIHGVVQ